MAARMLGLLLLIVCSFGLPTSYARQINVTCPLPRIPKGGPGQPLILTTMINEGRIQEAQCASMTVPLKGNITSYAGYFTVDEKYNSNLYFMFFPAMNNPLTAPVVLWLQGEIGVSALYGVFDEIGPFSAKNKHGLKTRIHTWTTNHSVIFIDNPVGAGYSFTKNKLGYSRTQMDVATNLYNALLQFFTLFPQYHQNELFIAGSYYSGKFVPSLGYLIHHKNSAASLKINLKGLVIGNGFTDPKSVVKNYADYLFHIGLLSSHGQELFRRKQTSILRLMNQSKWNQARIEFDNLISGSSPNSIFHNLTGFSIATNFLHDKRYITSADMSRYLSLPDTRKNLHVGNNTFISLSEDAEFNMYDDIMQSVKISVETLLENYRILFYSGQLDMIVPYSSTSSFLDSLNWSGAEELKNTPRKKWLVAGNLAGYSTSTKTLSFVLVRNAGNSVATDQPEWCTELITTFTRGTHL